jgi:U3 small nucleolar RNA-associated protein 13
MVWSTEHLQCVAIGEGHTDAVGAICVSRNKASYASRNAFIATGGADKILKRWALPAHSLPTTYSGVLANLASKGDMVHLSATHSVRAHDKDINTVAVSPNDAMIASASQDKSIRLWRSADLTPLATLNGHKRGVWKVCFSPVDKVLVSSAGDRTVKMWSVADYSLLRTFEGHTASVLSVKFVNKGSQLVSASSDGLIRIWTIRTGECEATLDAHTDRVWALECLQDAATGADLPETEPTEGAEDEEEEEGEEGAAAATSTAPAPARKAPLSELYFFSGGSDSKLIQWKDNTVAEEKERMHTAERNLVLEQQMHNDLRHHRYDKALTTALDLGHSLRVLHILTAILEKEVPDPAAAKAVAVAKAAKHNAAAAVSGAADGVVVGGSSSSSSSIRGDDVTLLDDEFTLDWSRRLDPYVRRFSPEQLDKVVSYLQDWNTNARNCYTCQVLLGALLREVRAAELMKHRVVLEALPGLLSYSERHYQRLDRLNQASYMLDYFASMMSLLPIEDADKGNRGLSAQKLLGMGRGAAGQEEEGEDDDDAPLVLFSTAAGKKRTGSGQSSDEDSDLDSSDDERRAVNAITTTSSDSEVEMPKSGKQAGKKVKSADGVLGSKRSGTELTQEKKKSLKSKVK